MMTFESAMARSVKNDGTRVREVSEEAGGQVSVINKPAVLYPGHSSRERTPTR